MILLFLTGTFSISVLLGIIIIPQLLRVSFKKRLFDIPNDRKVHSALASRLGGVIFFPIILVSMCLVTGIRYQTGVPIENLLHYQTLYEYFFLVVGCILLYMVGLTDDLIDVRYRYKFAIQFLAASLLVLSGSWINSLGGLFGIFTISAWVGMPFTVLVIIFLTNAINLIDGIDGLASGLSSISLSCFAIMYIVEERYIYAMLALATLGVVLPFWYQNVFGNARRGYKLFMGDTGSLTLGYILSFLVIHLSISKPEQQGNNPEMIIAFSTLLVPMLDVVRVVFRRLRTGNNPFLPDTNHFHHKLLRTGMSAHTVLISILFIALFFIGMNAWAVSRVNVTWLLALNIVLWTLMHVFINHRIRIYICKKENSLSSKTTT